MFTGMLSLLAGAGNGYNQGVQRQLENDRQAKMDQIRVDAAAREKADWDRQNADRATMTQALQPVQAVDVSDAPAQGAVAADGWTPTQDEANTAGDWQRKYQVGNQTGNADDARPMLAAANSDAALAARTQAGAIKTGNYGLAMQAGAAKKHLQDEGHIDFVKANLSALPDSAPDGTTFPLAEVAAFDGTGDTRIPKNAVGMKVTDAQGQRDFQLVDKDTKQPITAPDGTVIPSGRAYLNFFDPQQQERDKTTATIDNIKFSQTDKTADNARADLAQKESARHNKAEEGLSAAQLAESRANRDATLSRPFEVTDASGKNILVQQDRSGNITPVQGYGAKKVGDDKPLNADQSKALGFAARMKASGNTLDRLESKGVSTPLLGGALGSFGDAIGSDDQQLVGQAQRDFVNAVLRRESGASISPAEFNNAKKQYFPQIGDSESVKRAKTNNRRLSMQGILAEVPEPHRADLDKYILQDPSAPSALPAPTGKAPSGWSVVH